MFNRELTHVCERCRRETELFHCRSVDQYLCEDCIMALTADHYDRDPEPEIAQMKRIIIELDVPDVPDKGRWHSRLVTDLKKLLPGIKYIAVEDVTEPAVISGYRDLRHRNPSP
jgi:hypothetical protein